MSNIVVLLSLLACICSVALAFEPSPLQDFCVADLTSSALVNGLACKDLKLAQAEDFFLSSLHLAGNTSNPLGSRVSPVNVAQMPGLNTLGISMVRLDFAPWGLYTLHLHPRAREILTVLEGVVRWVRHVESRKPASEQDLKKGDVFVFPMGLIHFQHNVGYGHASAIAALSSQNPGDIGIANAVFGSNLPVATEVLTTVFQLDKDVVESLKTKF